MLFPSGPLVVNSRFQVFPGSCYPVIVVYVVHVDPVSWHPTFLVILLGTPKPLLGLLDIVQGLLENLCEVFQEKVANTFWKFEVPVQRKPVESHTPCLVLLMQGWCVPDWCVPDRKFLDVTPLEQSVPWILCLWPMCPDPGPRCAWIA